MRKLLPPISGAITISSASNKANAIIARLPPNGVEELFFDQIQFTNARPSNDPIGILKALIRDESHGLSNPQMVRDLAVQAIRKSDADAQFRASFPELNFTSNSYDELLSDVEAANLREPSEEFLIRLMTRSCGRIASCIFCGVCTKKV